jgi:hydroxylamine reductase (hybrid-cluster protein)
LQELAKVFKTDVNGLPLSLDISWFEQKAVAVLLTLLHLGVKNIRWAAKQHVYVVLPCCLSQSGVCLPATPTAVLSSSR